MWRDKVGLALDVYWWSWWVLLAGFVTSGLTFGGVWVARSAYGIGKHEGGSTGGSEGARDVLLENDASTQTGTRHDDTYGEVRRLEENRR